MFTNSLKVLVVSGLYDGYLLIFRFTVIGAATVINPNGQKDKSLLLSD